MARLPGWRLLRLSALFCAQSHLYTPRWLELRFNSRVTVEGWTPIASAIDFFEHFLCSNTEIVYLCSEVSCLYISNAKLINLWEIPVSHYCFLHCQIEISSLSPLLGAARPQTPRCFSGISLGFASTWKLHFYLELRSLYLLSNSNISLST